jgi:hypothetical protein
VLRHNALESTQSVSRRSKNCVYNKSTSEQNKSTHTNKIMKPKDGEKTREWLIPWSTHSVYGCRSNKPRYSSTLMEPKGTLICSKQLATGSYLEPVESSLHFTCYFLNSHFYIAPFHVTPCYDKWSPSLGYSNYSVIVSHFPISHPSHSL